MAPPAAAERACQSRSALRADLTPLTRRLIVPRAHLQETVVVGGVLAAQGDESARPVATAPAVTAWRLEELRHLDLETLRAITTATLPVNATSTLIHHVSAVDVQQSSSASEPHTSVTLHTRTGASLVVSSAGAADGACLPPGHGDRRPGIATAGTSTAAGTAQRDAFMCSKLSATSPGQEVIDTLNWPRIFSPNRELRAQNGSDPMAVASSDGGGAPSQVPDITTLPYFQATAALSLPQPTFEWRVTAATSIPQIGLLDSTSWFFRQGWPLSFGTHDTSGTSLSDRSRYPYVNRWGGPSDGTNG